MSSPTKRRTQRSSASATPRRATRNSAIPSSPAPMGAEDQLQSEASQASSRGLLATPSGSRLQAGSTQSQSPLFFRSSPVNGSAGDANGAAESDGGATPKASAMNMGGKISLRRGFLCIADRLKIRRLFTMLLAPALAVPATRRTPTFEAAAVPCSSVVPNQQLVTDEVISTPMSLVQVRPADSAAGCLLTSTACPLVVKPQTQQPSPT